MCRKTINPCKSAEALKLQGIFFIFVYDSVGAKTDKTGLINAT